MIFHSAVALETARVLASDEWKLMANARESIGPMMSRACLDGYNR
jgi:hypothetical protein